MKWIIENKEWIFSGAGVAAITLFVCVLRSMRRTRTTREDRGPIQLQKSGEKSTNIQVGGNLRVDLAEEDNNACG